MGKGAKKREAKKQMEESAQSASASGNFNNQCINIVDNVITIRPKSLKGKTTLNVDATIREIGNLLSLVIFSGKPLTNCIGEAQVIKKKESRSINNQKFKLMDVEHIIIQRPTATKDSKHQFNQQLQSMINKATNEGIKVITIYY